MSNEQVAGRIAVIETLSITALGLYLANSSNDPDYSKANFLLDWLQRSISERVANLNLDAKIDAEQYAGEVITTLRSQLRVLRGEAGPLQ